MAKMIKKILLLITSLVAAVMLAGCNYEENITIDENGEIRTQLITWYSADEFRAMYEMSGDGEPCNYTDAQVEAYVSQSEDYVGKKLIDGVTYYGGISEDIKGDIYSDSPAYTVSKTEFVYDPSLAEDDSEEMDSAGIDFSALEDAMSFTINITLPDEIVITNGKLSKDKKTATFDIKLEEGKEPGEFYAFTAESDKIISLTGLTGDNCTKAKKIYVKTDDTVKSIKVNGVSQKSKTIATKENGTYEIEVTTKYSTKKFTIVRDASKPKVSGVKNGKTYAKTLTLKFSDSLSGIKSATLNGEEIKTKKKVSKNGDYTLVVTDNAGNKKTVKFTIKK